MGTVRWRMLRRPAMVGGRVGAEEVWPRKRFRVGPLSFSWTRWPTTPFLRAVFANRGCGFGVHGVHSSGTLGVAWVGAAAFGPCPLGRTPGEGWGMEECV